MKFSTSVPTDGFSILDGSDKETGHESELFPCPPAFAWKVDLSIVLLITVFVFIVYFAGNPISGSTALYYADTFERSANYTYPNYKGAFFRIDWESLSSTSVIVSRLCTSVFPDSPEIILSIYLILFIAVGTVGTYLLLRAYLGRFESILVTVFFVCGRTLLGATAGLGLVPILCHVPCLLLFLFAWRQIYQHEGIFRLIAWSLISGIALALSLGLGIHETITTIFMVVGLMVLNSIRATVNLICRGHSIPWRSVIFVIIALLFTVIIDLSLVWGLKKTSVTRDAHYFSKALFHKYAFQAGHKDIEEESDIAGLTHLFKTLYGSFVAGDYLDSHGSWHRNTFLPPSRGFNGIIPLALLPGLLVGSATLSRRYLRKMFALYNSRISVQSPHHNVNVTQQVRIEAFCSCLLVLFLLTAVISRDPKPTRYTLSILGILLISVRGWVLGVSYARRRWNSYRVHTVIILVIALVGLLAGNRLVKNAIDVGIYRKVYAFQTPASIIVEAMKKAGIAERPNDVTFVAQDDYDFDQYSRKHPSMGFILGWREPLKVIRKSGSRGSNLEVPLPSYRSLQGRMSVYSGRSPSSGTGFDGNLSSIDYSFRSLKSCQQRDSLRLSRDDM